MPRSKRRIEQDQAAKARCKVLVQEVAKTFTGKVDAASIVARIQFHHANRVSADAGLLRYLWALGLQYEVRSLLKQWDSVELPDEAPAQLSLFPAVERELVRKIARARIWVPSRGEHLAYHPGAVSDDELRESADYYVAHGMGEIRLGQQLRRLADLREWLEGQGRGLPPPVVDPDPDRPGAPH